MRSASESKDRTLVVAVLSGNHKTVKSEGIGVEIFRARIPSSTMQVMQLSDTKGSQPKGRVCYLLREGDRCPRNLCTRL